MRTKRLEEELRAMKGAREHIMLVDLGRNDIGRSCVSSRPYGRRNHVRRALFHVMHLVSSIAAAPPDADSFYARWAACFPAGTLTGAPKVRARNHRRARNPPAAASTAAPCSILDFSAILTPASSSAPAHQGPTRLPASRAGIVADSVPAREHQECLNKAQAISSFQIGEKGL